MYNGVIPLTVVHILRNWPAGIFESEHFGS